MDKVKDAFINVRSDIDYLNSEIGKLHSEMNKITKILEQITSKIENISENNTQNTPTHNNKIPTSSTHPSTRQHSLEALKPLNSPISIGNGGVPTDRQTDRQTDNKHLNYVEKANIGQNIIDHAAEILDSLDSAKKEIRLKFKRLTDQELLVFSTLYQFDEESGYVDYKILARHLNLTESSIRDYIGRLIKKKIPIEKVRINNKNIQLKISNNLKKIASLSTILHLREL